MISSNVARGVANTMIAELPIARQEFVAPFALAVALVAARREKKGPARSPVSEFVGAGTTGGETVWGDPDLRGDVLGPATPPDLVRRPRNDPPGGPGLAHDTEGAGVPPGHEGTLPRRRTYGTAEPQLGQREDSRGIISPQRAHGP